MATKSCIEKHSTIKEQSKKIEILKSKIAVMEEHIALQQNSAYFYRFMVFLLPRKVRMSPTKTA